MSDNPLDDPDLSQAIRDHYAAIEEEFDAIKSGDPDAINDVLKKEASGHALVLLKKMIHLAKNADSETVQLNAQKAVLGYVMGTPAEGKESGVQKLIDKLLKDD